MKNVVYAAEVLMESTPAAPNLHIFAVLMASNVVQRFLSAL